MEGGRRKPDNVMVPPSCCILADGRPVTLVFEKALCQTISTVFSEATQNFWCDFGYSVDICLGAHYAFFFCSSEEGSFLKPTN